MIRNFFVPTRENKYKPYLLSKVAVVTYSFVLIFVNSFGGLIGLSEVQASSITPSNIINLTNQERLSYGLNTLSTNAQLSAAALAKANDMFEKQYWDHFGPNGESPWQFIRGAGYDYVYAGENLAKGFRTAEGIHEAWMASPTHKENIVSGNYKDIGVAVVEGELLGKQTTLVVQMFGNLTDEVYGVTEEPVGETPPPAPPTSSEQRVVVNDEVGEIKSIRITSPKGGVVLTDPSVSVKGETENVNGEYVVQVYDESDLVGDTKSDSVNWEFVKGSDWEEGEHSIFAQLEDEADVKSDTVVFTINSKAPVAIKDSIKTQKEDDLFIISFEVDGEWDFVGIVSGSEVIEVDPEKEGAIVRISLPQEEVKGAVTLVLSDEYGNTSELDITEYFIEEESKEGIVFPSLVLSTGDKISVGIVAFILILILIEVYMYWKRGNLKDVLGDVFTVGVWWIILTLAIFNGFSGVIN